MKSSSYFEERSERRMKKMHDKATKCMTKVNKAYDDSLERLKKEIDHISDGSSLTEKIDYDKYKELLQIYNTTKDKRVKAEAKRLIKENSASYRIQRKEALSRAIEIEKLKQVDSQLNLGGKHLKDVYSSVLNDLGSAKVSKKYLDEVLNHEWAGSNFSKRVWHNQDVLAKSLESNLLQSFASGKSNKQIADELEYHTNLGRYAANRLIRTETSYMVNSADLESSKQRGIKAKKFQANLDKRTSKICREHNQKVILIDDIKIGVNAPPLHPFCRSFLSDVLEGWDYETEEELMTLVTENTDNAVDVNTEKEYNISDKVELPTTLSNFKEYGDTWEKSVVSKELTVEQIELIGNKMSEVINNSEYAIRVDSKILDTILDDGRFKNQFETKTSGGALNFDYRKKATKQLFGKGAIKDVKDYEKYGYLGTKDFIEDAHDYKIQQYGNCIIHFDKKYLKNKVTYTLDDSLGQALNKVTVAGDSENPRANGINKKHLKEWVPWFEKRRNKMLEISDFMKDTPIRYIELQYHGELKIDFIKEICFTGQYTEVPDELVKKIKSKGIKVFKLEGEFGNEKLIEL